MSENRDEGDGDVELLFDGDTPEGIDGISGNPAVKTYPPVAGKEAEGKPGEGILGADIGDKTLQQDQADDYVISTGVTHSIRDLLEVAFARVGIADWERYITQDPRFMRPADVAMLIGDSAKAHEVLGWKPKVGFTELVEMMVDNDLKLQRAQAGL